MCIGSNFADYCKSGFLFLYAHLRVLIRFIMLANDEIKAMKFLGAGVYTNFTTTIHNAGDMEIIDAYLAGPKGHRLEVKFHYIKEY